MARAQSDSRATAGMWPDHMAAAIEDGVIAHTDREATCSALVQDCVTGGRG